MIPNLRPLIEPLIARFPAAWAKAKAPGDTGEFNARVCAVLYYELGRLEVGRNGKRGDPNNLSRDIINWKGEGRNPDPTAPGNFGTVIDFLGNHESGNATIIQAYTDPDGPAAWVKPQTFDEIDESFGLVRPPVPAMLGYEEIGGDEGAKKITRVLDHDYKAAGRTGLDGDCGGWLRRIDYDVLSGKIKTVEESIVVHRDECLFALGLIVALPTGMMSDGDKCLICGATVSYERGKRKPIPHAADCTTR